MATPAVESIRNVAFVGHGDAGKTTLVESLLFKSGAINRKGDVKEGTTISDWEQDERDKAHSIRASLLRCDHKGHRIHLIDTPGYPDFQGEGISALRAVETAIFAISATGGIGVNTRAMWAQAVKEGVARVIVVTKMDGENIELDNLLASIRETFGDQCHCWDLPDGTGSSFSAVYSVLHPPDKAPPAAADALSSSRDPLMETIVEVEDKLVERYLDGETLSDEEVGRAASRAIASGTLTPILFVSSDKDSGIAKLLDFIVDDTPGPKVGLQRKPLGIEEGDDPGERLPDAKAPFAAQVIKVVSDPFVGKLSYVRIFSGTLAASGTFLNSRTGKTEKVGNLLEIQGKEQKAVESASAGQIVAISKVDSLNVSDTLSDEKHPCRYPPIDFPQPMVQLACEPKKRGDETKIGGALARLAEEDPTFKVKRDEQTAELIVSGMSNLHLDVILHRLKKRFDVEVETRIPSIPYWETITGKGDAKYRHKKQTGGAGQFGEVWLRVEPTARGEGFEFSNDIVGGSIPHQYVASCEKGIRSALGQGVVSGNRVVDVKVSVYDGKHHPVDSKDIAFQIAARNAFREAFRMAKPVLLEPVMKLLVTIPVEKMGDITGDLNGRRGRIHGMETTGNYQTIEAEVPLAEMATYCSELRSMTGGEGTYSLTHSHYDVVPPNLAQEIMAKAKKAEDDDD